MTETLLPTYDPEWQVRWALAHAALKARQSERLSSGRESTTSEAEQHKVELSELNTAYHAQFRTVEAYRDNIMEFETKMGRGHNVPQPCFREGASLEEVDALLWRFREDVKIADRMRHIPTPADPPGLAAFTTSQRPGSQRTVEDFVLLRPQPGYRPIECRVALEATERDLHVCMIEMPNGGSVTNNIEELATAIYRQRFAPKSAFGRVQAALGFHRAGLYSPHSIVFYEYRPWTVAVRTGHREELCIVRMKWAGNQGFVDPDWDKRFPSVPPYLSALADTPARALESSGQKLLC